jgi:hypothetical protein
LVVGTPLVWSIFGDWSTKFVEVRVRFM